MGRFFNPNIQKFEERINSEIYIDKSMLLEQTNKVISTSDKYICVSRPRRFGKSTTAEMLSAYYNKSCNSKPLFNNLKITSTDTFHTHLNKYNVCFINIQQFLSRVPEQENLVNFIQDRLIKDFQIEFLSSYNELHLTDVIEQFYYLTNEKFVFIIDEWDCIFREKNFDTATQRKYLDFLRDLLKDQEYVALAYMTGILPIKKYGTHSALNMFNEVSMLNPGRYAEYTGFTSSEVQNLCEHYNMPYSKIKIWYDGYKVGGYEVYNPRSVVSAMTNNAIQSYWTKTETYESLRYYITLNIDGLQDTVLHLITGNSYVLNPLSFTNDMITFVNKDDVLTLLVHLGYLTFNQETSEVTIPNEEVKEDFVISIKNTSNSELIDAVSNSDKLLLETLNKNELYVANAIEKIHEANTSILQYNDENSLSCVVSLAYISAKDMYVINREYPTGKGFADLIFLPKPQYSNQPAIIFELKCDSSPEDAINQIKDKDYIQKVREITNNIILIGISYNKKTKRHSCKIESFNALNTQQTNLFSQ